MNQFGIWQRLKSTAGGKKLSRATKANRISIAALLTILLSIMGVAFAFSPGTTVACNFANLLGDWGLPVAFVMLMAGGIGYQFGDKQAMGRIAKGVIGGVLVVGGAALFAAIVGAAAC